MSVEIGTLIACAALFVGLVVLSVVMYAAVEIQTKLEKKKRIKKRRKKKNEEDENE